MDTFNFNLFKYFYYIVIYNGFTNASKYLNISQPSLSFSIKRLEEELNAKLIVRNSKQFVLTEEGNKLFQTIKPFFEKLESNLNFIGTPNKIEEIKIGIRFSYSFLLNLKLINLIKEANPNIKINVSLYSKLDTEKFKNGEYDIVIDDMDYLNLLECANKDKIRSLNNYFICGDESFVIFKNVKSVKEMDLKKFIAYNPSLKNGKFRSFCYDNDVSFTEYFSVNESNLYFKLVQNDMGIGFSNELLIRNHKGINIIPIKENIFKDELGIAFHKQNHELLSIIEIIKKEIKGDQ